ncbi:MAG: GNAT family N-acetyltransferase [Flavobacteriaceae bacterium]|nr:GNAT family N-acetyltransferase [Flavobacteriaceae bacterium]
MTLISLRKPEPSDTTMMFTLEHHPEYRRFEPHFIAYSWQDLAAFNQRDEQLLSHQQQRWIIVNERDFMLGIVDVFDYNEEPQSAWLGIVVDEKHQQQGIAFMALQQLINHLKSLGLKTLLAKVLTQNTPSRKLFQKAGFERAKQEKEEIIFKLNL